jgi:Domain of unknown function (DUF222)
MLQQIDRESLASDAVLREMDASHVDVCRAQRRLLRAIAETDRSDLWKGDGAHDVAHWLWMRYGLSQWKAQRWVQAAHALESLPRISEALCTGRLGVDKVVELSRFATRQTEEELLPWAEASLGGRHQSSRRRSGAPEPGGSGRAREVSILALLA